MKDIYHYLIRIYLQKEMEKMSSKHTVEKIGGTSMTRFGEVLHNVIIGHRKPEEMYNRIFIVSAYGGITNMLLENKSPLERIHILSLAKKRFFATVSAILVESFRYFVSLWSVSFLQNLQYLLSSMRSGSFFLFLVVL